MPEERKLVTVLFADIVGSTAMTAARDPELVRAMLRRTFDALRPILPDDPAGDAGIAPSDDLATARQRLHD